MPSQIYFLTRSILNIFSNYCPHKYITVRDKDVHWMTTDIKKSLKEKTKLYRRYVKNVHRDVDKIDLEAKANECSKLISETKANYLANLGSKLNDPFIGPKKYWH